MSDDRERWNEKYRDDDEFDLPENPIPELARRIDTLPDGRALDVATGTGRNARFLADHGYDVDAVDVSDEALDRAERRADDRDQLARFHRERHAGHGGDLVSGLAVREDLGDVSELEA